MHRSMALFAPLVLAACASAADPGIAHPRSALEVLRAGGTYGFVLDESDPAATFHAQCTAQHPGDAAGADTCYAAIRKEAAVEGIRFTLDAAGRLVWTSYGIEEGKPATYMEAPLVASLEKEGVVASTMAEKPHGLQVDEKPISMDKVLRFEVPDADTVVMTDPHKGKLVFRRMP
jgi:hypothetical protein